jgi:coenzyme F420-0:L-glutamate ligase / coenzyme F420-1:gamma-L-glutamate ligase
MQPSETLHEFLRTRRSVRRFLEQEVPRELVERILETASWAPSAHNRQPWRFAVLMAKEARMRLAEEMGADFRRDLAVDGLDPEEVEARVQRSCRRIIEAPLAIVLCLDPVDFDPYPDADRQAAEHQMGVQSVALSGGWLLLAAHAEGLGGVWVCAPLFASQAVRRALGLPAGWEPQGLLLLGYPAKNPDPRPRKPIHQVAQFY